MKEVPPKLESRDQEDNIKKIRELFIWNQIYLNIILSNMNGC